MLSTIPEIGQKIQLKAAGSSASRTYEDTVGIVEGLYSGGIRIKAIGAGKYYKSGDIISFDINDRCWKYILIDNEWDKEKNESL